MSLKASIAAVAAASADNARQRALATTAWNKLKEETERATTPGRVLGAGLIAGFVSGLRSPRTSGGVPIGDKVFNMLVDTAFASFGAAMAAGAAAAAKAPDAPVATSAPAADTRASQVGID